jgi:hypothetical protein
MTHVLQLREPLASANTGEARPGEFRDVQFIPARWLVLAFAVVESLFSGGRISKLGIAGLVWAFTPRSLKLAAAGLAVGVSIVLLGAIAAITLLALQLT